MNFEAFNLVHFPNWILWIMWEPFQEKYLAPQFPENLGSGLYIKLNWHMFLKIYLKT